MSPSAKSRQARMAILASSLIGAAGFDYPKTLRAAVLASMDAKAMSVADISRLHWRLGEVYADAVAVHSTAIRGKARPHRLPRPDHLPSGNARRNISAAKSAAPGKSAKPPSSPSDCASRSSATFAPPTSPPAVRAPRSFPCSTSACSARPKSAACCKISAASQT